MRILVNAKIYTMDSKEPFVTAMAVDKGSILAIGDETQFQVFGRDIQREDIGGRIVIPGLIDAHIHLKQYALNLPKINCELPSQRECLQIVKERATFESTKKWILGHGWNQNDWIEGFGSATILDKVAPKNPVYLTAKSLHAGWVNTLALQAAGINENTPDPPDGQIQRNESGQPTGILFEGAMQLVERVVPQPSLDEIADSIQHAQHKLWQFGITGLHDFDQRDCFAALQKLHTAGNLRLRVLKSLPIEDLEHAVALGLRTGFGDDWLRIGGLKAFADGALGPHTAAMLTPYENDPENKGMLLLDREEVYERGCQAISNGLSLAIHAIGDGANHEILNAFEQLQKFESTLDNQGKLRHRIEHVQLTHPDDAPKLSKLGIIASMQPIHAISDMKIADEYWGNRAENSYAWRTQLQHGAKLAFGSDAPVESPNPFWGLHAAVTRQRPDGFPEPISWYPEQCITIQEAIQAYTIGPAFAAGLENHLGKIAPGYYADLIVLENDPFTCDPVILRELKPKAVMVGGEWVIK